MKEQNAVTNEQAREALDRILNFCEEIDNHIPPDETTGYKMLPDYFIVSRYLNEAGYRKQSDVIDDFVRRLLDAFPEPHRGGNLCPAIYYDDYRYIIEELAEEMKGGE